MLVVEDIEVYLNLAAGAESELDRERLEKELAEAESHIARLEKLLSSPFAQKLPRMSWRRNVRSWLATRAARKTKGEA